MATLNVSDEQKQRVIRVRELVARHFPVKISQADVVDMGMAALEEKYTNLHPISTSKHGVSIN